MDNIIDKLGFFDFLNLIIAGLYTITSALFLSWQFGGNLFDVVTLFFANHSEDRGILYFWLGLFLIVISYVLGVICQEMFDVVDHRDTFKSLMATLFSEDSCIDNSVKLNRYKKIAKTVLDDNGIEYELVDKSNDIVWTEDLSNYFYAYCVYQVQMSGMNQKIEKLRDIEGFAKAFCGSSAMILILSVGAWLIHWRQFVLPMSVFAIECISLAVVIYVFSKYRKKALKNRIRMTLGMFEAIYSKELKSSEKKAQMLDQSEKKETNVSKR